MVSKHMADGANGARPCLRHAKTEYQWWSGIHFINFTDLHFEQIISLAEIICAREASFFLFSVLTSLTGISITLKGSAVKCFRKKKLHQLPSLPFSQEKTNYLPELLTS